MPDTIEQPAAAAASTPTPTPTVTKPKTQPRRAFLIGMLVGALVMAAILTGVQLLNKSSVGSSAFLLKNRYAEGVVQTPSGLQYKVLKPGKGASRPTPISR